MYVLIWQTLLYCLVYNSSSCRPSLLCVLFYCLYNLAYWLQYLNKLTYLLTFTHSQSVLVSYWASLVSDCIACSVVCVSVTWVSCEKKRLSQSRCRLVWAQKPHIRRRCISPKPCIRWRCISLWEGELLRGEGCHVRRAAIWTLGHKSKKADVSRCVCGWRVLCQNISKFDQEL